MTITLSIDLIIGLVVGFTLALLLMNVQTVSGQIARNPSCGCGCLFGLVFVGIGLYLLVVTGYWSF